MRKNPILKGFAEPSGLETLLPSSIILQIKYALHEIGKQEDYELYSDLLFAEYLKLR